MILPNVSHSSKGHKEGREKPRSKTAKIYGKHLREQEFFELRTNVECQITLVEGGAYDSVM